MPRKHELMKRLIYLIIILLELIFVFSYRNLRIDIEEICEDCAADTVYMAEIGAITIATQTVIGIILYLVFNIDNNLVKVIGK